MAIDPNLGGSDLNPEQNPLIQKFLDDLDALQQMQSGQGLRTTPAATNSSADAIDSAKQAGQARITAAVTAGQARIAEAHTAGASKVATAVTAGHAKIAKAEEDGATKIAGARKTASEEHATEEKAKAPKKPVTSKSSAQSPRAHTPKIPSRATAVSEAAEEAGQSTIRKAISKAKRVPSKGGGFSAGLKNFLGETTKAEAFGNVATPILEGVKAVNDDLVQESLGLGAVHAEGIESTNRTNQIMGMKGPDAVGAAKDDYQSSAAELEELKAKRGTFTQGASTPLGMLKDGLKERGMKSWTGGFLPRMTGGWIADDTLTTDNEMAEKKNEEAIKSKEVGLALKEKNYEQKARAAGVAMESAGAGGHAGASGAAAAAQGSTHGGGGCGCCTVCCGGENGKGGTELVTKGLEALHDTVKKGHAENHRTHKRKNFSRP